MIDARATARALKRRARRVSGPPTPEGPVGPPDFIGVGTQRSGTTWWYRLVCTHPNVIPGPKERHFFDRFWGRPFSTTDAERYATMFPRRDGFVTGEWTPRYMHEFWVPALIRRAAPNARLLVLLRDPLARFRSGVSHETSRFLESVKRRRRGYASSLLVSDALGRSLYGRQLENLFHTFPAERVLVLQYERCVAQPAVEMRRTLEFLGVEPLEQLPDDIGRRAGRPRQTAEMPVEVIDGVRRALATDLELLKVLAPDLDLGLWDAASAS